MSAFKIFLADYPPSSLLEKPTQEVLDFFKDKLPASLLDFWKDYGFGNYGNGIIKIVNPLDYQDSLRVWLGLEENDFSRIPIAVSGFGNIYYYRKNEDGSEDYSILDIHYREIDVCDVNLQHFFNDYLAFDGIKETELREQLFKEATEKLGKLSPDEIFYFAPAMAVVGGDETLDRIAKGNGAIHQILLLEF